MDCLYCAPPVGGVIYLTEGKPSSPRFCWFCIAVDASLTLPFFESKNISPMQGLFTLYIWGTGDLFKICFLIVAYLFP